MIRCDVLVIGAGPAGLYAAYYAGFRGFSVIVVDALSVAGGQISAMYPEKEIFDVAGFPTIKGKDLVDGLLAQAGQFNPKYLLGEQVIDLQTSEAGPVRVQTASNTEIEAKSVIITGGIGAFSPRELPVGPEYVGKGVVYFVPKLADHAGRDVVIVGGGDSAFDWAYSLFPIARSVTLVHRRDSFRAHASSVQKIRDLGVELITDSEVCEINGDDCVSGVSILNKLTNQVRVMPAQTIVAALGFVANIGPIAEWGLELSKRRIVVGTAMQTNLPRVFAAGDITVYPGKVPLISVGFGEAGTAVNNAAPLIDPSHGVFPGHSTGSAE